MAEQSKRARYAHQLTEPTSSTFVPLGFDVYGGWGQSAENTITQQVHALSADLGCPQHVLTDWIANEISSAIWLHNARTLMFRLRAMTFNDENLGPTTPLPNNIATNATTDISATLAECNWLDALAAQATTRPLRGYVEI